MVVVDGCYKFELTKTQRNKQQICRSKPRFAVPISLGLVIIIQRIMQPPPPQSHSWAAFAGVLRYIHHPCCSRFCVVRELIARKSFSFRLLSHLASSSFNRSWDHYSGALNKLSFWFSPFLIDFNLLPLPYILITIPNIKYRYFWPDLLCLSSTSSPIYQRRDNVDVRHYCWLERRRNKVLFSDHVNFRAAQHNAEIRTIFSIGLA